MKAAPGVMTPVVAAFPSEPAALRARCRHPDGDFVPFAKSEIEGSVVERFERQAWRYPDRPALETRKHSLTYAQLNERANRVAQALLARRGETPESVGLLFENGAPFVIASLGALKAGKIHLPLESTFPLARLAYMLEQSGAGVVVTDDANEPLARELTGLPLINIDRLLAQGGSHGDRLPAGPGRQRRPNLPHGRLGLPGPRRVHPASWPERLSGQGPRPEKAS